MCQELELGFCHVMSIVNLCYLQYLPWYIKGPIISILRVLMCVNVVLSDPLVTPSLTPYTSYTVRLAAMNSVGLGQFSTTQEVQSQGFRKYFFT